jgi:hypothetical protein
MDYSVSDNRINRSLFIRSLYKLEKSSVKMGNLYVSIKSYLEGQKAFAQDEYSRSATVDWLISEGQIYKDRNNRLGLADEGHRTYFC